VFLVAQHMLQFAVTGQPAAPMPERISRWGIYDVFSVQGGAQIFLAVVGDTQWRVFCEAFGFDDLYADPCLTTNNDRVRARDWLMPVLRERMAQHSAAELGRVFEDHGLPFAPIMQPQDLFHDPHLLATGGLAAMQLPDGRQTQVPLMPITMGGLRPGVRSNPPRLGEHTDALLLEAGYTADEIRQLKNNQAAG
jgi:crotonobetainyl-CoA:carnitine CoA-transferase CaiB-like acyl-CoA transferase